MKKIEFVLFLVLVFVITSCGQKEQNTNTAVSLGNEDAFSFEVTRLDGRSVKLQDYEGKALLLNFWDTWCPPCRAELPYFIELYDQYQSKGLEILGVAFGRNGEKAVREFIKDNGINYPNAIGSKEIVEGFGPIQSIPTTFMIDATGKIYKKYIGSRAKDVFEKDIKAMLNIRK